ncbi:MAG: sugar ABC transporter permease, partial [Lactococcus plantarum]|nr:sugar ABC transporter permease [Lactococcus plantarum]MDN6085299.1 sugar ABC transporter permease [Lactococcus plantarum]
MNKVTNTISIFQNGDGMTKLSFIVMGAKHFAAKQLVKGLLFLLTEIAFISFMITSGFNSLANLITLGTQTQTFKFDQALGFKVRVSGDNSMLLLIYGICTIFLIIGFFIIWYLNLNSAQHLEKLIAEKKHIPNFVEEVHDFLDGRFHLTLLTIPTASIILFTVLPLVYMISIAFTSYDHKHLPPRNLFDWVGLSTFSNMFSGKMSGTFLPLLGWTLVWATLATFTCFFFGVILALMLNAKGVLGKKVYRMLFVITMAVPPFISLLVMKNLLHTSGPINTILMNWHLISEPLPFLTNGLWAKISVIVVNMWIGIPASMLITTAVIINLPEEQLEAARIDGANPFQIFRSITFPQILTANCKSKLATQINLYRRA